MSRLRRALPFLLVLAFAAPAHAGTVAKPKKPAAPQAPQNLHAFLLRADEPPSDAFPRTPSFAWTPVPGAVKYEFELAASASFTDTSRLWAGSVSGTPALAVPIALPWMTGKPYALYARVRTVVKTGISQWSVPFGFNMRADDAPLQVSSYPGLVHWSIVPGATSYQIWWTDIGKQISSLTTYADEREFYTLHQYDPWPSVIHWRVRAVRNVYGSLPTGLPVNATGPWSPIYTSYNPPFGLGSPLSLSSTVSETVEANGSADATEPHTHTPAFLYNGNLAYGGNPYELYRVYVFTDADCVNEVFRGAVVGSPAYSPRPSGTLALPATLDALAKARLSYLPDGSEGNTFSADLEAVKSTESSASSGPTASTGAAVDLWDSGWPTGRYHWTVVPVKIVADSAGAVSYRDTELPQEACSSSRVGSFGKLSDPVLVADNATSQYAANTPFVSGLSTDGKLIAAAKPTPKVYGTPLVAWLPALGAASYEVQWGRQLYPWKPEGTVTTSGTSVLLDQGGKSPTPGFWYYRVRGVDPFAAGPLKQMTWSDPVKIQVAAPVYKIVGKVPTVPKKKAGTTLQFKTWVQSGFAVGTPVAWAGVDHSNAAAVLKSNPRARTYLKPQLEQLASGHSGLTFLAYDPDEVNITTALGVSTFTEAPDHTHAQFVHSVRQIIGTVHGQLGSPVCAEVRVSAGPAVRCSFAYRIGKTKFVETETSYWFDRSDKAVVLSLDRLKTDVRTKAPLFARIVKSFKVTS
jgi:hypothetical protein